MSKADVLQQISNTEYVGEKFSLTRDPELHNFWVLRTVSDNRYIDNHRHRYDIAEQHNLKLVDTVH